MTNCRNDRFFDQYPDILYPEDVGAILGIGRTTLYRLLKTGEIKSLRIGNQYRVPKSYLLQYIDSAR